MHLRYYLDENGKRVYTLQTILPDGSYTLNAHPGFYNYHFSFLSPTTLFIKIFIELYFFSSEYLPSPYPVLLFLFFCLVLSTHP